MAIAAATSAELRSGKHGAAATGSDRQRKEDGKEGVELTERSRKTLGGLGAAELAGVEGDRRRPEEDVDVFGDAKLLCSLQRLQRTQKSTAMLKSMARPCRRHGDRGDDKDAVTVAPGGGWGTKGRGNEQAERARGT